MELKIYLPYYDYNDDAFNVNDSYYDENEYINAMSDEYNKSKDIVFNSMIDFQNGSQRALNGSNGQMYHFNAKPSQNEDKVSYSQCLGVMYNDEGINESVDELVSHFVSQDSFIEMIELDADSCDEEFETELSLWINEHKNISLYGDKFGEEWVWKNEPKRNMRGMFINKSGEEIYFQFDNCKIMDLISNGSFILFIERMRIIDKFE